MKPTESVRLLALAVAAFPGMSVAEGTPEVWHELLGDLDASECRAALLTYAKAENRIVTPADIRKIVIAARQEQISRRPAIERGRVRVTEPPPLWHETKALLTARRREKNSLAAALVDTALDVER